MEITQFLKYKWGENLGGKILPCHQNPSLKDLSVDISYVYEEH